MNNNIEKYINRRLKRILNQLEFCKDYDADKNTFHGGWEKGYCEGQLRVLEDISDMIEEVRDEEMNRFESSIKSFNEMLEIQEAVIKGEYKPKSQDKENTNEKD